jgi:hypothetical protein
MNVPPKWCFFCGPHANHSPKQELPGERPLFHAGCIFFRPIIILLLFIIHREAMTGEEKSAADIYKI